MILGIGWRGPWIRGSDGLFDVTVRVGRPGGELGEDGVDAAAGEAAAGVPAIGQPQPGQAGARVLTFRSHLGQGMIAKSADSGEGYGLGAI